MAGRAAVGRTSYENASQYYFLPLYTNAACPEEIKMQALFDYGNALMSRDSTNKAEDYQAAIAAFKPIAQQTTNTLRILAWGQIASCYLQWAQTSPQLAPQPFRIAEIDKHRVDRLDFRGGRRREAEIAREAERLGEAPLGVAIGLRAEIS